MNELVTIIALLSVLLVTTMVSRRFRLQENILLFILGGLASYCAWIPTVKLNPDVIFLFFLPPHYLCQRLGDICQRS